MLAQPTTFKGQVISRACEQRYLKSVESSLQVKHRSSGSIVAKCVILDFTACSPLTNSYQSSSYSVLASELQSVVRLQGLLVHLFSRI